MISAETNTAPFSLDHFAEHFRCRFSKAVQTAAFQSLLEEYWYFSLMKHHNALSGVVRSGLLGSEDNGAGDCSFLLPIQ